MVGVRLYARTIKVQQFLPGAAVNPRDYTAYAVSPVVAGNVPFISISVSF